MQVTDKKRFATLLTGIADYYGKELSESMISLFWQGLQQFDIDAVEKALWEHTQNPDTGQFMPKIADVTRSLQGRTQDQAALAWSKVDSAIRRIGPYSDVVFDDIIIHRVIADMGGWIKLGTQSEEDWPFVSNQFQTRYRGYRLCGEVPNHQPILTGLINAQNAIEGFCSEPPILIGNDAKAQMVMFSGTNEQLIQMKPACNSVSDMTMKRIEKGQDPTLQ